MTTEKTSRVVVVTGGTRGLGKAIVETFEEAGDEVWSLSRTLPDEEAGSASSRQLTVDVRNRTELDAAVSKIQDGGRMIDVWINNAGYGKPVPFADGDNELWDDILAVNFGGTVHATRAVLPALKRPGGAIINVASVAGLMAPGGHSAYATAKAAVIALTRAVAVEYAQTGIRVNAVAPGPLDTAGFRAAGGDPVQRARSIPTRKMVAPTEVASACFFLAGDGVSLTGETLVIDGGSHAAGCYV